MDVRRVQLPPLRDSYTHAEAVAAIEAAYALLPPLTCRGMCANSCTQIAASALERDRAAEAGYTIGENIPHVAFQRMIATGHVPRCPALGPLNNCRIYSLRPLICRAFGTAIDLNCEFGCQPDWYLDHAQVHHLIAYIEQVSFLATGKEGTVARPHHSPLVPDTELTAHRDRPHNRGGTPHRTTTRKKRR